MNSESHRQQELLRIEKLYVRFKAGGKRLVTAVNGIDFQIKQGETVALVGESGCGKSVTSLSIMGLIPKNAGEIEGTILLNGKDLTQFTDRQMRAIRGNEVAMIFQEPMTSLNPVHKIGKQIGEVFKLHKNMSSMERRDQTIQMLKKVGIPRVDKVVDEYPHQLSGGMRQRVMIAMAMACNPSLLIADEPTTALDVTIQAQILELMNELKTLQKTAILLITHDLGVVAEMADRVMVMYYGQIVEQADVYTLFTNPKHPYTIGLLASIPNMEEEQTKLQPIEGNVPGLGEVSQGCPFRSRCPQAFGQCAEQNPPLVDDGNHAVRCWLHVNEEVSA
jgi:peptide/nickel transport system ATP-binding protein